ncbi:MAG: hypothetical protein J6V98_03780 [Bacteroidales bacterium]|nr:hypothetical protein [Bacteroidales bacterium]
MRQITQTLIIAIASLTLYACSNNHAIKEAAYNYSYAMANYQVDDAAKYSTNETIETTIEYAHHIINKIDTAYIIADTPAIIEIASTNKTSDTTAYAIYHKVTPIKDFRDTLQLRKREGKWLAHAPLKTAPRRTPQQTESIIAPETN